MDDPEERGIIGEVVDHNHTLWEKMLLANMKLEKPKELEDLEAEKVLMDDICSPGICRKLFQAPAPL